MMSLVACTNSFSVTNPFIIDSNAEKVTLLTLMPLSKRELYFQPAIKGKIKIL
jgi:hypothetical protein